MGDTRKLIIKQNERQRLWKAKLKELDNVVDHEGIPIDQDIKETITAFNLNGFPTLKSCGGHIWQDCLRFPFVLGRAAGMPENRFTNDKKIRQKIALTYFIPQEEIEISPKAAEAYYKLVEKQYLHETREYKAWDKQNRVLRKTIRFLLQQFYSKRTVSQNAKIYLARSMLGYLVMTGRMKIRKRIKIVKPSEIPQIQKNIIAAQKEMKAFTEFLKNRFFNSAE